MFSSILYVMATGCLLIGSTLIFEYKLPDYFFVTGSSLFLFKAVLSLICDIKTYIEQKTYDRVFDL